MSRRDREYYPYGRKVRLDLDDETKTPEARIDKAHRTGASELWLGNLSMSTLPESVGQLAGLRGLYLPWNKPTGLPACIAGLGRLCRLSLRPGSVGHLSGLRGLYLHGNKLTALPDCIGQLAQLRRLYLDDNLLGKLPESIGRLSRLEDLSLYNNRLTWL